MLLNVSTFFRIRQGVECKGKGKKKKRPPRHHDEVVSGKIIMTKQLN